MSAVLENAGTCGACRHAARVDVQPEALFCCRFPPQMIVAPKPSTVAANQAVIEVKAQFPGVSADSFCGEYVRGEPRVIVTVKPKKVLTS